MPSLTADGRRLNGKGSKWITPLRRLAIYLRDGFRCAYCDRDLTQLAAWQVTLDHLRPKCRGGEHHSTNLVAACTWCNSARQHQPLARFVPDAEKRRRIYQQARRKADIAKARAILRGEHDDPRSSQEN